jgi:predicted transcriptional regulator YdeE
MIPNSVRRLAKMEYQIVNKDRFVIIGVKKRIKSESPYFTNVWNEFMENYDKVKANCIDDGFYGINDTPDENNLQDYIAGIAVNDNYQNSDKTFIRHIQPSSIHAVFECKVNDIGATYIGIFSGWNDNRYRVNDKNVSCFEYYPPNTVTEDDKVLLYIPVIENI